MKMKKHKKFSHKQALVGTSGVLVAGCCFLATMQRYPIEFGTILIGIIIGLPAITLLGLVYEGMGQL